MWRHIASNFLTVFIVVLAAAGGLVAWGQAQYSSVGPLEQAICVRVESGSTMSKVSEQLAGQGAISSPQIFRIGADYSDKSAALKAGSFLVPEGASMAQIVDIVTRGGASTCGVAVVLNIGVTTLEMRVRELDPTTNRFVNKAEFDPLTGGVPEAYAAVRDQSDVRFSIALAEGVTSWQVVEGLKAAEFLTGEIVAVPAEGSLAPDSYEVRPGADRGALLAQMEAAQVERLAEVWRNRDADIPISTPEEALILASLIEKETGVADERPEVAAVFVNRLRLGMRLQTDPTVIYGITLGQGTLGRGLRRSELDRTTPYNTYRIDGLPPTPIANPGLASLQAAVNPVESEYLFFVADGTGGHAFAVTLAEHNENVARWRVIEAERANP